MPYLPWDLGDILYLGTATGSLLTYTIVHKSEGYEALPLETRANFTRRSIDALGYLQDKNSLVVLSEKTISLYPLPKLAPATPLTQAKGAFSFTIHSSVQHLSPTGEIKTSENTDAHGVPTDVTRMVVGCQKKLVVYTWKDGEASDSRELHLPHSPRSMAFCSSETLVIAYETEVAVVHLSTMSVAELIIPSIPSTASVGMGKVGMGAFSGLSGYMTLGLGKGVKPLVVKLHEGEVLVNKDGIGTLIGPDGKISRNQVLDWPTTPVDIAFVKPYILSILPPPPSSLLVSQNNQQQAWTRIHVRSSLSLATVQTLSYPSSFLDSAEIATPPPVSMRSLVSSPASTPPAFFISTPNEKAVATAEGSTIWALDMQSWGQQIDELVDAGQYPDALALLGTLDNVVLEDKDRRVSFVRALYAVSLFSEGKYDEAIDIFLELDTNPAKVVAMYPPVVSGRLWKPQEEWITLFGGKRTVSFRESSVDDAAPQQDSSTSITASDTASLTEKRIESIQEREMASSSNPPASTSRISLPSQTESPARGNNETPDQRLKRSVEVLMRYLTDRRPKLSAALLALNITPAKSADFPFLSETSLEDLLALPDAPLSALVPEQLLRFAQITDTALFKCYLLSRPPSLIGSLCRVPNWYEVTEVEEVLRERKQFSELIDLYQGKKMHEKGLNLLHDLSIREADLEAKLQPAIRYLQKLGPQYLPLIFSHARWVLEADPNQGLQIFTAEEVQLPRKEVADFLEDIDLELSAGFLEYLIDEVKEPDSSFHDRLADIYLKGSIDPMATEASRKASYARLLTFIKVSDKIRSERLYSQLPSNTLYEARAILLGRMNRHEAALEIYVHRLQDFSAAEEYCKQVYQRVPDPKGVFLTLLRIYLREPASVTSSKPQSLRSERKFFLDPAKDLISRHGARLDPVEVLELLPPLVSAKDVRGFLLEALDGPTIHSRVTRELWKARRNEVDAHLLSLRERRVKVADTRICPQCHKRLGNSVIAVHTPRGEVTHYQCREAFASRKMQDSGRWA